MSLLDSLKWRYAVKRMNGNKIPEATLNTILEATKLAPSSFGLTPYNIIVIEDEETRKKLQPHFYNFADKFQRNYCQVYCFQLLQNSDHIL